MTATKLQLPEDTETLGRIADFNVAHLTMERDENGNVYLVSWWYGDSTIMAVIRPGGSVELLSGDWY